MKSGTIFWGTFLISFGILLLLKTLGFNIFCFDEILKFWPLLIIIWGISLLKINKIVSYFLTGISALLLALFLSAMFFNGCCNFRFDKYDNDKECSYEYYSETSRKEVALSADYNESIKEAKFYIDGGAAVYKFKDTSDKLISIYTDNDLHDFNFSIDSSKSVYVLDMNGVHFKNFFKSKKSGRVADISLNRNVSWDLEFNLGAAELKADLSQYIVSNLEVDVGAASVDVKLGDMSNVTNVSIEAGASSINIEIPKSSACKIESETGLSDENFNGFTNNGGIYTTENLNNSAKMINIKIQGGVSSFKVIRY